MQLEQSGKQASQPQQISVLQQTLQQIEKRVMYFSSQNISAQNSLNQSQNLSIRSISQILTHLKYFDIAQTPLNMGLSMVYTNDENKSALKWNIPPASQGEDSINEQQTFEPSFKWLVSTFIDPNLLEIDQPQPRRIQKGKVPQEWVSVSSLLLTKVTKKIYLKSQMQQIQHAIRKKFSDRYSWLKFKRTKEIYYKGKPCIMLKFGDSNSASFVYYNFATFKSNRDQFGENCEVFRVIKDDTREYAQQKNWILLLFRHLPLMMTKQQLMAIINVNGYVKWIEDLVEIAGAKYTFCKVSYLDDALRVCEVFNSKKIKDAKVNIHPKSSKNWRAEEIMQQQQQHIIEEHVGAQNEVIPALETQY